MTRSIALAVVAIALAPLLPVVAQGQNMMSGATGEGGGMGMERGTRGMSEPQAPKGMSEGEVRKIDPVAGKLTLRHGHLQNLDMPGMTMVFRVRDPAWFGQMKVGDKVRFVAERVSGNLTVTELQVVHP